MGHGGKEGVNACFKSIHRHLVDESFGLDAALVVVGEQHLDDRIQLEVHE